MKLVPRLTAFGTTSLFIKRDYYEPELLLVRQFIRRGSVVLDIGASFGVFSLFMAEFTGPTGKIHSFEPGAFSFSQLKQNVALNAVRDRIVLHNVGAGDQPAVLKLHHLGGSPVNFSLAAAPPSRDGENREPSDGAPAIDFEEVSIERVDAVVPEEDQALVSFIKIDVEGFERAALEGARAILEKSRPPIMFEVAEAALARAGMTPCDMYAYLAEYGYRFYILDRGGALIPAEHGAEGNIFAIHKS